MAALRVIVVGGGMAGLGAAWRLAGEGCEVCVLERGARPGGRMQSERRDGFTLEPGARLFWTADRNLRRLLHELGREDEFLVLRAAGLGQVRAGWLHEIDPRGLRGIARLPGVALREAVRTVRLERLLRRFGNALDPWAPERAASCDDRSLADFGRLYFGSGVLSHWMEPFAASAGLCDAEQTSRVLFLLQYVARRGATPALLRSGAGALPTALARRLELRLGAEATRVEANAPGGALVRFRDGGIEGTIGADAVVVAVPAVVAGELAEAVVISAERDFFAQTRYLPALTLIAAVDDPIVPRPMQVRVPQAEGWPVQSIALEPGRRGGRVPDGCALVTLTARADWSRSHLETSDDAIAKELLARAGRLYPALSDRVRFTEVARHPLAVPRFDVGRYRAIARFQRIQEALRREGRRVYFAGDYLVAPTVEGALTSGWRAAAAVQDDLAVGSRRGRS